MCLKCLSHEYRTFVVVNICRTNVPLSIYERYQSADIMNDLSKVCGNYGINGSEKQSFPIYVEYQLHEHCTFVVVHIDRA